MWQFLAPLLGGLSVVSQVAQMKQASEAAKMQRKAQKAQTAMETERNRKAAVQSIREARIKAAAIQQSAINTGSRGSGEQGATGSIQSQLGSNLGFQGMEQSTAINTSNFLQRGANAQGRADTYGALSGVFTNLYNIYKPKV